MAFFGLIHANCLNFPMAFSYQNPDAKVDENLSKFVKYPEVATTSNMGSNPQSKRLSDERNGSITDNSKTAKDNNKTVPVYRIIHRGHFNMQDYTMARLLFNSFEFCNLRFSFTGLVVNF